jgi:hypothetical protein
VRRPFRTTSIASFTAALLIGGLINLDRRPVLAGVLFGILTIKPQLGFLLPIMLLLTGRWRVIAAAAATAFALAALTAGLFGVSAWLEYVRLGLAVQHTVMTKGTGLFLSMMPTAFMNARVAELPLGVAWALQAIASAAAVGAVTWTYWRRRDPILSTALLVTASFLATPYVANYDMVVFGWVIAQLRERGGSRFDHRLALAVWWLPLTTMLLGVAGIPGSCLVLVAFAARLIQRLAKGEMRVVSSPDLVPALAVPEANAAAAVRPRTWA